MSAKRCFCFCFARRLWPEEAPSTSPYESQSKHPIITQIKAIYVVSDTCLAPVARRQHAAYCDTRSTTQPSNKDGQKHKRYTTQTLAAPLADALNPRASLASLAARCLCLSSPTSSSVKFLSPLANASRQNLTKFGRIWPTCVGDCAESDPTRPDLCRCGSRLANSWPNLSQFRPMLVESGQPFCQN